MRSSVSTPKSTGSAPGNWDNTVFTPFRLRQGVYGQRQADVQMIRVKLPGGIISADMLDSFGDITEKYAPLKKGHITTRENIQLHHIPLEQTSEVLRILGSVGPVHAGGVREHGAKRGRAGHGRREPGGSF